MGRFVQAVFCSVVSLFIALSAQAQAQAQATKAVDSKARPLVSGVKAVLLKGDAVAGKHKAEDERCVECHGHDGNANDIEDGVGNIGKFPRLASQHPSYIIKQFREFRSGKRNNETMAVMAKTVSDTDLVDIAAYFASQKLVAGSSQAVNSFGRSLFHIGDAARGILPCVDCHIGTAQESAPENPRIAGQHRRYLQKQLIEWRAGERSNSPGNIMNAVTKGLSDVEIDALADYVSSLQ